MNPEHYKILVVDDEQDIVNLLDRWLGFDYDVVGFSDPWKALKTFKNEGFHLLITDLAMEGVDGFQFLKAVQTLKPHVSTIVMTAHKSLNNAVRAQQSGADYIFFKPLDCDEFQSAVKTLYERQNYWMGVLAHLSS